MTRSYLGFGLALVAQVLLLAAVPWRPAGRETEGRLVWLRASAADRRGVLQGDYLGLQYEIAAVRPGDRAPGLRTGDPAYVVLAETSPGIWTALRAERRLPDDLPEGQVALRGEFVDRGVEIRAFLREEADGTWAADSVVTGGGAEPEPVPERALPDQTLARAWVRRDVLAFPDIETYFVPERLRSRIAADLRAHPDAVAAQVAVDADGRAALRMVRVQDRVYDF